MDESTAADEDAGASDVVEGFGATASDVVEIFGATALKGAGCQPEGS